VGRARRGRAALLGGISNGRFYEMKKKPSWTLDADTLTCAACSTRGGLGRDAR
jgi:hypothetical protein